MDSLLAHNRQLVGALLIVTGAIALWLAFRHVAPVPDVAWLTEGARRWMNGARLYLDVREINPPLIFYDILWLSGGTTANYWFAAGVALATAVSSLWVARYRGMLPGIGVFISASLAGSIEFAQREHLLVIFVAPYLLARGGRVERTLAGVWAFFGVALKPYFLPVVILPALIEAGRDWRSLLSAEKLVIAIACFAYLIAAWLLYPTYFTEIIPQARYAYTYGMHLPVLLVGETLIVCAVVVAADKERRPLAAATLGALASYYVQGRFWPYHFIGAAGLAMILAFWQRHYLLWAVLAAFQLVLGTYQRPPHAPIPQGVDRVAVLSVHPSAAYPGTTGCGVTNVFPYGSLGSLVGPWNIFTDPKASPAQRLEARTALLKERKRLRTYIEQGGAQVLIVDARKRKPYFKRPFDFVRFIGPFPEFRQVGRSGYFEIWSRKPLSGNTCAEHF